MKTKIVFCIFFALFTPVITILITLTIFYWDRLFPASGFTDKKQLYQIVATKSGLIRGIRSLSIPNQKIYYSYLGIPYAKPPINDLRFRPPKSIESWNTIKDVTKFGEPCLQIQYNKVIGSEDCLNLNVFVPNTTLTKPDALLPVMILIFGGGYFAGNASEHGPEFLMDYQNVVLVTFNYRLGPLGFLSLETLDYSGNMGLKDQLMVMKWVNSNIHAFGGDANLVTLFGYSAGSTSIHLHLLSPASSGLFQQAILQSGTSLNPWSFAYDNRNQMDMILSLSKKYGNISNNSPQLVEFLKTLNGHFLIEQLYSPTFNEIIAKQLPLHVDMIWRPTVEGTNVIEPFFTKTPIEYLSEIFTGDVIPKNITTFYGFNSAESLLIMKWYFKNPKLLEFVKNDFEIELPFKFFNDSIKPEDHRKMIQEINEFYFGNLTIDVTTFQQMTDLLSDALLIYGIVKAADVQSRRMNSSETFFYVNSIVSDLNLFRKYTGADDWNVSGASHSDETCYLFASSDIDYSQMFALNSVESKSVQLLTSTWTNFAKHGKPILEKNNKINQLQPITLDKFSFVNFTNYGPTFAANPLNERIQFWNNFYAKYFNFFL